MPGIASPTDPRGAVVLVLLDALRHDGGAAGDPWGDLPAAGGFAPVTGAVEENFGFQTRPAYFAGLFPETSGLATMMVHAPETSPFRTLRLLPGPLLRWLDRRPLPALLVRRSLTARLRRRTDAAGLYGTTLDVPLDRLAAFDFAEKELPWDGYGGYPTLFSLLAAAHEPYLYVGYPFVRDYGSDATTVEDFCRRLRPDTRFAFLQLNELDGTGHAFGPDGPEYASGVKQYQTHMKTVIEHCRAMFNDDVHIIVFGDHGMVSVTRAIDAGAALSELPSAVRGETTVFLDSTLVRVWCRSTAALAAVRERLDALPGGRLLSDDDRARFRIRFPDDRLGQLVFLADPGVVIHPNYFDRSGRPVRGMHGYDPAHPANRGALMILSRHAQPGDVGVTRQVDLFPTALDLLGYAVPASCNGRSLLHAGIAGRPQ